MKFMRSCIACRNRENGRERQSELLRLVVIDDQVKPDPKGNLPGRGAWLHPRCFEAALKRGSIGKAFRGKADINLDLLKSYLEQVAQ